MKKNYIKISVIFVVLTIVFVNYYHIKYLSKSGMDIDIQRRLKNNNYSIEMKTYERLQDQIIDNKIITLYRFKSNNEFVGCAIYEKSSFGKYKFDKIEFIPSNADVTMVSTRNSNGEFKSYIIHFGYVRDNYPNKYKISSGGKTFVKEYKQDNYFLDYYDISNSIVEITPVYENDITFFIKLNQEK